MTVYFHSKQRDHLIKVSIPLTEEDYRSGYGESVQVFVDQRTKDAYDRGDVGPGYFGALASKSNNYPSLALGNLIPIEMRGEKQPVVCYPVLLECLERSVDYDDDNYGDGYNVGYDIGYDVGLISFLKSLVHQGFLKCGDACAVDGLYDSFLEFLKYQAYLEFLERSNTCADDRPFEFLKSMAHLEFLECGCDFGVNGFDDKLFEFLKFRAYLDSLEHGDACADKEDASYYNGYNDGYEDGYEDGFNDGGCSLWGAMGM